MKQYKKGYELKNAAKDKLDGRYGSAVLICFVAFMISRSFSLLIGQMLPTTQSIAAAYVTSGMVSLILSWLLGILDLGLAFYFLKAACGIQCAAGDLFFCFQGDTKKTLSISGVRALVNAACLMPTQYLLNAYLQQARQELLVYAAITSMIGLLIYLSAGLGVMLAFYLLLDFPAKSAGEILRLSFQIIRGNRKKLFFLQLSFLPLIILCVCSLSVGFLWLLPYMNMTYACFFLDLMNPKEISS